MNSRWFVRISLMAMALTIMVPGVAQAGPKGSSQSASRLIASAEKFEKRSEKASARAATFHGKAEDLYAAAGESDPTDEKLLKKARNAKRFANKLDRNAKRFMKKAERLRDRAAARLADLADDGDEGSGKAKSAQRMLAKAEKLRAKAVKYDDRADSIANQNPQNVSTTKRIRNLRRAADKLEAKADAFEKRALRLAGQAESA